MEQAILRKPVEQSSGFLTTTLRRYVNRQRLEQLSQVGTGKDFDKVSSIFHFEFESSCCSCSRDLIGRTPSRCYVNR